MHLIPYHKKWGRITAKNEQNPPCKGTRGPCAQPYSSQSNFRAPAGKEGKGVARGHSLPVVAMKLILHIYRRASFTLRATPALARYRTQASVSPRGEQSVPPT